MPPRAPQSLMRARRTGLSTPGVQLHPSTVAQYRLQSTSEPRPSTSTPAQPPTRPTFSRAKLAAFAAEGELLTSPSRGPAPLRPGGSATTGGESSTRSLPKPVLKANPYAAGYTVNEAELLEPDERAQLLLDSATKQGTTGATPTRHVNQSEESRPSCSLAMNAKGRHRRRPLTRTRAMDPKGESSPIATTIQVSPTESVTPHAGYLTYTSTQHNIKDAVISHARLRDSCHCRSCRDGSTKQKLFTTGQAVAEVESARPIIAKSSKYPGTINFTCNPHTDKAHSQKVPMWHLRNLADPETADRVYRSASFYRKPWTGEMIAKNPHLRMAYDEIKEQNPRAVLRLLEQLQTYGLVVVEGVPTDKTGNEDCTLREVANYIGEIRNTFYGETWNVKSVQQSKNVAYTNLDLGLHMDLLYFSSPPRFQALHCLRNRVNGGESYFVDSFRVAHELPSATFQTLASNTIPYIYDNDNHFLRFRHPVISPGFHLHNPHAAVNWSPPFRATGEPVVAHDTPGVKSSAAAVREMAVYSAIAEFERRLADPKYKHSFTMKEGDLVLFDNRRVLHARTAFYDKTEEERAAEGIELVEGEPTRWLKGCYLDGEVIWDKLAVLRKQVVEEAREQRQAPAVPSEQVE
ncbi:hypothetical protein IAU60_000189 [Kwoniella sp. DSM 27419]